MKKNTLIPACLLAVLLLLQSFKITDQPKDKKPVKGPCLKISGAVESTEKRIVRDIKVYLIEGNVVKDSLCVSQQQEFGFELERNKQFAIKVVRPGYLPRLVSISTILPDSLDEEKRFRFHFDLFQQRQEDLTKVQEDIVDFPVAVICYDRAKGYFDYNDGYTNKIKEAYKKAKALQQ